MVLKERLHFRMIRELLRPEADHAQRSGIVWCPRQNDALHPGATHAQSGAERMATFGLDLADDGHGPELPIGHLRSRTQWGRAIGVNEITVSQADVEYRPCYPDAGSEQPPRGRLLLNTGWNIGVRNG